MHFSQYRMGLGPIPWSTAVYFLHNRQNDSVQAGLDLNSLKNRFSSPGLPSPYHLPQAPLPRSVTNLSFSLSSRHVSLLLSYFSADPASSSSGHLPKTSSRYCLHINFSASLQTWRMAVMVLLQNPTGNNWPRKNFH